MRYSHNQILLYVCLALLFVFPIFSQIPSTFLQDEEKNIELVVNNRVLAIVDNKPITVMDVMKKMDLLFFQEYPEYRSSKVARYQFYNSTWKAMLKQAVNEELILAEMENNKMPVTAADIRQELETRFGPNIIVNLDKMGLSMDEARKMLKDEISIRRIMMSFAAKGMKEASPVGLKKAYEEYSRENVKPASWVYRVITLRDADPEKCAEIAESARIILQEQNIPLENLLDTLKNQIPETLSIQINISEEYQQTENEISPLYKEVIAELSSGSYSNPIMQKGRKDHKTIYRILYVKEAIPSGVPPFEEIAGMLKDQILQKVVERESNLYLTKIRKRHAVDDGEAVNSFSPDFTPFALQQKQ